MRFRESVRLLLPAVLAVALMTGCASTTFVYKPSSPVARGTKLPMKIAVLPFTDGTEDFTRRGSFTDSKIPLEYNLAKAGWGGMITALTPELWAKGFADELAASGSFQAVRFVFGPSELTDEAYCLGGRLNKATIVPNKLPNEFALELELVRRSDNRKLWSKAVSRKLMIPDNYFDGCWGGQQCGVDRYHAYINRTMQSLFAEAGADLAAAMTSTFGSGSPAPTVSPPPSDSESVDAEIEKILHGK